MGLDLAELLKLTEKLNAADRALETHCRVMRTMCDLLPLGVWAKDINEKYLFANKACCEIILNAETSEVIGKDDMYFANRERAKEPDNPYYHTFGPTCSESDQMVLQTGEAYRRIEEGYAKGKKLSIEVRKYPLVDEEGNVVGVVGCSKDITGHRRRWNDYHPLETDEIQPILRKDFVQGRYRAMFENARDAIFLMKDDKYIDCNVAATKMFNCTKKELLNINPAELSPAVQPDGVSSAEGVRIRTTATIEGQPQRFLWKHFTCDGIPFCVEVRLNRISFGGRGYSVAVLRDASEFENELCWGDLNNNGKKEDTS